MAVAQVALEHCLALIRPLERGHVLVAAAQCYLIDYNNKCFMSYTLLFCVNLHVISNAMVKISHNYIN